MNMLLAAPPLGKPFMVYGAEVTMTTPVFMNIILPVPWPANHVPDREELGLANDRLEKIIRYMVSEKIIAGSGTGCNVFPKHA